MIFILTFFFPGKTSWHALIFLSAVLTRTVIAANPCNYYFVILREPAVPRHSLPVASAPGNSGSNDIFQQM